jgi:hypothetical protein
VSTPPEAAIEERQFRSIIGTMPAENAITKVRMPIAGAEIVVQAESLWALAPIDMMAAMESTEYLVKFTGEKSAKALDLGGGWKAVAVFPDHYEFWENTYLLGVSWIRSPNGLLYQLLLASWIKTEKYSELASTAACMMNSLKPGMLFPEIPKGETRLNSEFVSTNRALELVMQFDGKHVFTTDTGADYVVFRIYPLVEYGSGTGQLGIYFGSHSQFSSEEEINKGGKSEPDLIPILGKIPTWIVRDEDDRRQQSTLIELPNESLPWECQIFISGTVEQIEAMVGLARTLRFRPRL